MGDGQVNCVAILDAIPDGELNTARRLRENLIDLSISTAEGLQVRYIRVNTLADLETGISGLVDETRHKDLKPWLHLEGHGSADETGFLVAHGMHCSWEHLKDLITPLNISTGLNLFLVLATCFGGSFARAILTVDRAPVLGLLGPKREVKTGQVECGFVEFYKSFFASSSLKKAIEVLNATVPDDLYYRTSAQRFFYDVWASYKKIQCAPQEIDKRARRIYRIAKAQQLPRTPSVGQLKRLILSSEKELFEKFRNSYFMYDLDEANRARFPVTYEEAEAYASR